ncbi:MAG: ParB/RepB/Spo0J family partition protein [Methylocella sp.]
MNESVELSSLDLRYESHRLRNNAWEARLLASMAQRGVEKPLEGVDAPQARFLLNGFKRYRCAKKLGIASVPYVSLASDEATGILCLMRASTDQGLGLLEQARFLDDLITVHGMSLTEVAETLSRSKAWVSLRRSLLTEMSSVVREALFRGTFPVYCYLYTLRSFKRVNGATREQIDRFVTAVAGKGLSVRDIDLLADGYFRGSPSLRQAIEAGKLGWSLERMKQVGAEGDIHAFAAVSLFQA